MGAMIRYEAVTKRFGADIALDAVSLSVNAGEFFALLGPSGCGKTTLMRMLAGFEQPDSGAVWLDGQDCGAMPPHRRPVNMMFQSYALFPHLNVEKNVAFGLDMAGLPRSEIRARTDELLDLIQLTELRSRMPHQISGGQRQRVALARALARRPKVLLLDEPLGALDKRLREDMQLELKAVQRQLGITFLMVTHDQDEAMTMADRIAVMDKGTIAQIGTPQEIYETPVNRHVARFVGDVTIVAGNVLGDEAGMVRVGTPLGEIVARGPTGLAAGTRIGVGWRPERGVLSAEDAVVGRPATVRACSYHGYALSLLLDVDGEQVAVRLHAPPPGLSIEVGAACTFLLPDGAAFVLDR